MPDPITIKNLIQEIADRTLNLSPLGKAKAVAYFYLPLMILGLVAYYGGGLASDSSIAVAELRTELTGANEPSTKRGLVIIAEPNPNEYRIPLAPNGAKIWSSLDNKSANRNKEKLGLDQAELKVITPFSGESTPVTLVVEGELGKEMYLPGEKVSIDQWGMSSRRSASLVYGVLIICSLALGMGVAVGFPPVKSDDDHTSQIGEQPNEGQVV